MGDNRVVCLRRCIDIIKAFLNIFNNNNLSNQMDLQLRTSKILKRNKWLPQEDDFICHLRQKLKIDSWTEISIAFSRQFPTKLRSRQQCRERYLNYLQYGAKEQRLRQCSPQEEIIIMNAYIKEGPRWQKISALLERRSQAWIKNKFNIAVRNFIREFNEYYSETVPPIIYEDIISFLGCRLNKNESKTVEYSEYREKIVQLIFRQISIDSPEEIVRNISKYGKGEKLTRHQNQQNGSEQKFWGNQSQIKKKQSLQNCPSSLQAQNSNFSMQMHVPESLRQESSSVFNDLLEIDKFQNQRNILERKIIEIFVGIFYRSSQELQAFSNRRLNMNFFEGFGKWASSPNLETLIEEKKAIKRGEESQSLGVKREQQEIRKFHEQQNQL